MQRYPHLKCLAVVPAYNEGATIIKVVEDLREHAPDFDVLVVDDGSTDDTAAIVERYVVRDSRIRLLRQANGGISSARNHALRESTAGFIAILDGDDMWEPAYLEAQLATFVKHPEVDVVTGNGWFLGGRHHGEPARPWPDTRPQPTFATILADETAVFIMSVMRRRVYETVGPFDERLRTNEDYDYWLRAAAAGFQFRRNDQPLGHYRRRDDSLSSSEVRMVRGILRVYEKTLPIAARHPGALHIVQAQISRFERELHAAEARRALSAGHGDVAATHLSALYEHGGGFRMKVASVLARWMPGLLARAYQARRTRQETAP